MANFTISVLLPHATPYDASFPTRSTENYAHALHEILQDMEDASFNIEDGIPSVTERSALTIKMIDMIEDVFDYAEGAIDTYRSSGTPTLLKPSAGTIAAPRSSLKNRISFDLEYSTYRDCYKMCFFIYYMWKTEQDPLLLKEKLQELLIAWPLTDTEIVLNEEGGQSMHIVPAWKNVDL